MGEASISTTNSTPNKHYCIAIGRNEYGCETTRKIDYDSMGKGAIVEEQCKEFDVCNNCPKCLRPFENNIQTFEITLEQDAVTSATKTTVIQQKDTYMSMATQKTALS